MKFNKDNLGTIRTDIATALAEVSKKHGIFLAIGNISFDSDSFTTKLSASSAVTRIGEAPISAKELKFQKDFKAYSFSYGFLPSDLGKEFTGIDGKIYTLVGARPRASNPLLVRTVDNKLLSTSVQFVKSSWAS
jgi:hypothetical protein